MTVTHNEARDLIFGAVNAAWENAVDDVFSVEKELRFASVEYRDPSDLDDTWGFCDMLITDTRQSGLRNDSRRRYTTTGIVTVDVSVPRKEVNSAELALAVGHSIRNVLQLPHTGGVWYRHVTAAKSRQTAGAVIVRVVADFSYTEEGESNG